MFVHWFRLARPGATLRNGDQLSRNRLAGSSLHSLTKALVVAERVWRRRPSLSPEVIRNVLILEYIVPLGNCVHMTPVFQAIKSARPDVRVSVATWGMGVEVFRKSPFIDDLLPTPNPLKEFGPAVRSLKRQLRSRDLAPDLCLTGASDHRTKVGLFAAAACSGWRGGFTLLPALYHRPLIYDRSISLIANNLRLAELLGIRVHPIEPKLFYSGDDVAVARRLLEPARRAGRPILIAVTQNSGGLPTAWHDERWAHTLRFAHKELGYEVFHVGTAADELAITTLIQMSGGLGTSLAGKTSINQLATLLAQSDMVLTLTTGTMHVARAVGTPMVVLNIAWERPLEWMPSDRPEVRILRGPDLESIPQGYRMDEISVEWACAELSDMSRLFAPDDAARETRLSSGLSDVDHPGS